MTPRTRRFRVASTCAATLTVLALATAPALAQRDATPRPAWADSLDAIVRAELVRTRTPGAALAVVVDGRLAYAAGYGVANSESKQPLTPDMLFRVGSVTKMFTAAALVQLAHDGKLALDKPIGAVIPELKGRVAQVTAHQLLSHSAGWIDNAVAYGRMGESALGEVMREITDTMFFTEPARTMSYSNPGYSMAGYVAEVAGKQRFGALVETTVLRPTGMTRATFRPLDALTWPVSMGHLRQGDSVAIVRPFTENTAQWGAGFLFASAPELAQFCIMMMSDGTIDGRKVLEPDVVKLMTTGYVASPSAPAEDSVRYAYGLSISQRAGIRTWSHGGSINGFDAQVTMLPDKKFAVVLLENLSGNPLNGVIDAAIRVTTGIVPPTRMPVLPRDATPAERAALVGRYAHGPARTVDIAVENGALVLKQSGATLSIRLLGTDGFVATAPSGMPVRMTFARGADGKVAYLYQGSRAMARVSSSER